MSEVQQPKVRIEAYDNELLVLAPFLDRLHILGAEPPGEDIRITAFTEAARDEIYDPAGVKFRRHLIDDLLNGKKEAEADEDTQVTYKANKLLRACNKYALRSDWEQAAEQPKFPEDFDSPDAWRKLFTWIVEDEKRAEEFSYDLLVRDVASNVPQRYVSIPFTVNLYRALYPDRFREPPRILDGGCSQNLGLTKVASGLPFRPVEIFKPGRRGAEIRDDVSTNHFNRLAGAKFKIGQSWGVDKIKPWDHSALEWAQACERYPTEHLETQRADEYDALYSQQRTFPEVNVNIWDFAEDPDEAELDFPEKSMDFIFVSNALYIIGARKRQAAISNLLRFAKADALFVWQEFASVDRNNNLRFFANPNRKPYQQRAYVTDLARRHRKSEELIRYRNGRCREGMLGHLGSSMMLQIPESANDEY